MKCWKSCGNKAKTTLDGHKAFDLYATHGLPLELTRDVAQEQGMQVDDVGFVPAMDEHRVASGAGKAFGAMGGEDVDVYRAVLEDLQARGKIDLQGVRMIRMWRMRRKGTCWRLSRMAWRCRRRMRAIRLS